jgi:hypothetical protein
MGTPDQEASAGGPKASERGRSSLLRLSRDAAKEDFGDQQGFESVKFGSRSEQNGRREKGEGRPWEVLLWL